MTAHALELSIKPDSNMTASAKETQMVYDEYKSYKMDTKKDKLALFISENRALANAYIQKHPLDYKYLTSTKHKIESDLSRKMVEEIQKNISRSVGNVVESYYIAHQDLYMRLEAYTYDYIIFDTFEEATSFYNDYKDNAKNALKEAKAKEIKTRHFEHNYADNTFFSVKEQFDKESALPQILPPQFIHNYMVTVVKEYFPKEPLAIDAVRAHIQQELFKKTYEKERVKLIKKMKNIK